VRLRLAGDGKVRASGAPLELLARLREHKAELAELLAGHLCRHCGEVMNWPAPVGSCSPTAPGRTTPATSVPRSSASGQGRQRDDASRAGRRAEVTARGEELS
jgi:hypothetical protein